LEVATMKELKKGSLVRCSITHELHRVDEVRPAYESRWSGFNEEAFILGTGKSGRILRTRDQITVVVS
jgi:hypothetical protein